MPRSLRIDGESDDAFRERAERTAVIGRVLIEACLRNACMQEYIADEGLPMITAEGVQSNPTVRIEYEEAIAIGGLGETLAATRSKYWGAGPQVLPLEEDDWFHPDRITYLYRTNSRYNRRFEQRKRMKELLGRKYRKVVGEAMQSTKRIFLRHLSDEQARAIRRILEVEPGVFWRAAKGKLFVELPPRWIQGELF